MNASHGDYIGGEFVPAQGQELVSKNPARAGEIVFETAWDASRITHACEAAGQAAPAWAALSRRDRAQHLTRFRSALADAAGPLADAILAETGKLRSEAVGEAAALVSRFDLVRSLISRDLVEGEVERSPGQEVRYRPLGVVGVIGPFNYPLHLCHAHAVPALLAGNAVVIKPSEVAPLSAQVYAECAAAAELPAGVINVVQGAGAAGAALASDPRVRGLCFTGSYAVGQQLTGLLVDRPDLLLALEMGGKNTVVVLDDADVRQAAHEIVVGGYLTTGQRCTATDRVLVQRSRLNELVAALRRLVSAVRFGDPEASESFAGPLTTERGADGFGAAIAAARAGGAEVIVPGGRRQGGLFVDPSLHVLPEGVHEIAGYSDVELFGPDVGVEGFDDDDEAIALVNATGYGLANSVFTTSDDRFEKFYRETSSGIINRNRSTNQASGNLPFGGTGKSGNYRPAGSHAARNVVCPVAVQKNVAGRLQMHPHLVDHMPPPELDRLELQHSAEEAREARRNLLSESRPMDMRLPRSGNLPLSDHWLTRLYAGERVVREKKPPVFDHLRSAGPWLVSVDDPPLSVLDGMSQTATLCGGFAEEAVVRAYIEGGFGDALLTNCDPAIAGHDAAGEFATVLRHLVPGLPHVTFTNSGAEANEKALALCHLNREQPQASKVLAFEGSFHGRTLLALHATHSPTKRTPFEISGYQASFVPFPTWDHPMEEEPAAPSGFYAAAGSADREQLGTRFGDEEEDPLLAREVESLLAVADRLATGDYFACIVEPMQSEGGDRYATARFFRALRLLTRYFDVPLIMDEVQTGFALGGSFVWHSRFRLVNFRGEPDIPDVVTFAKRAQLGVCMSRFDDPEPTSVQVASLVRGRIHAEMASTSHAADRIEKLVRSRLEAVARGFPDLVGNPRACGYAFAFDLPSPEHLQAYLGQRFWRGAVVFGAGVRTARYRLSEGYLAWEVDLLFEAIRRSLAWLDAHPGAQPPPWEDRADRVRKRRPVAREELRVRDVTRDEALEYLPAILDIEYRVYEPARRTDPALIRSAIEDPDAVIQLAELHRDGGWTFVGFAIGHPLEAAAAHEEGPDRDPMLGRGNTLYSLSLTVAPEFHGHGIGRRLKEAQLRDAASRLLEDGSPRYRFVAGRNRVGHTAAMNRLNRVFGSHLVCVLTGQYEDPEGQAVYYRIPLAPLAPLRAEAETDTGSSSMAVGISQPLAQPPASLVQAERTGLLYGPAVNKLTVMNYVTPAIVRALEWVSALAPRLPHLYLTSSRDETVDKSLRLLRSHRPEARVAIGFAGGYLGHTTAAARSLSDPAHHRQGPAHFDWPRAPHPESVGDAEAIDSLRRLIGDAGGPDAVFGIFVEPVQERTGAVISEAFWQALARLRTETGIPLIAVETATACYRSGSGPFATSTSGVAPDLLTWWGGAHTGYIHVVPEYRVSTPLAMVSTWDGDELSLMREHHQLRAARKIDVEAAVSALDGALARTQELGMACRGAGLYRVVAAGERAVEIAGALAERGLAPRVYPGGHLAFIPPLDRAAKMAGELERALAEVLG